ncbi:MAG: ABC transporter permease [Candidatus Binatia bacterium]
MNTTAVSRSDPRIFPTGRARSPVATLAMVARVYRHRSLVVALLLRQLKLRYRGSILGFVWTFLNPLLLMTVYALVFSFYMRIAVPHYALFLLAGLLPWTWFATALSEGTNSIVGGSSLVTKSLFPSEILPTVVVLSAMVNFIFSIPLLLVCAWLYGVTPDPWLWVCLPPVIALQCVFTLGLVLALAALNVHYRDVQHIVTNVLLLWFFLTPIIYPLEQVPENVRSIVLLNPMSQFAEIYQAIFVHMSWPGWPPFGILAICALVSLLVGARVFDGYRDSFPELV